MLASSFFDGLIEPPVPTEGIKYAGSKLKIIPHILDLANYVNAKTILDGFSGTTRVSQAFARRDYQVICNDSATWSEIFGTCYLLNNKTAKYHQELIDHLNSLSPVDGWFTENYGGIPNGGSSIQSDGLKKPWQIHNTRKADAIREEIEALALSKIDKAVSLVSLILALDQVDNTLGHFASYLKNWSPRSYKNITLKVPNIFPTTREHSVYRKDILDLVDDVAVDLAYLDPPYGSNNEKMPPSRVRYASYYHLWTSICLFDKPEVFGKSKRRKDTSDKVSSSVFEEFRKSASGRFAAVEALEILIKSVRARWVILSYSSGGRATINELNEILNNNGKIIKVIKIHHKKNVMAKMHWTNEWVRDAYEPNQEFLFLLEKV